MKKLSDFKGEEAIDLWADLLDYATVIFTDPEVRKLRKAPKATIAKVMLKLHKKEVCNMLLTIDDTPIDGLNIMIRLISLLKEIESDPDLKDFFDLQGQREKTESSGSATAATKEKEH